jgi:hypothetical protein
LKYLAIVSCRAPFITTTGHSIVPNNCFPNVFFYVVTPTP